MTMLGLSKNKNGSCNTQNGIVTVNGSSNIVNNIGGNISLNRN
jgi:hypothetical protein